MKLSEIQKMVETDMVIDDLELDKVSLNTPQLHNKYLQIYTQAALAYRRLDSEYKVAVKE